MAKTQTMFILFAALAHFACGMYVKSSTEKLNQNLQTPDGNKDGTDWGKFKRQLGLTNQKVELLKSQKDQPATLELISRFIKENPKYVTVPAEAKRAPNHFQQVYRSLLKQLKMYKSPMKTSLNFEMADKPLKNLKRPRRKIAVRMVSDMPSERIDELLEMFNQQHGIDNSDLETDDQADYGNNAMPLPSAIGSDYMYDNLYEDEEDLSVPAKSNHNSQYGSFQDLILQARHNQWQREVEETKLSKHNNEHFV